MITIEGIEFSREELIKKNRKFTHIRIENNDFNFVNEIPFNDDENIKHICIKTILEFF